MKKLLILSLTVCVLLGVIFTVAASAADLPFTDVKTKAWYYSYVKESYEKGYMEGKPGGLFAPNESVTRAQYVTILARLCEAEADTDTGFKDVGAKKWYAGAVGWAVKAGIVTGYEDNTFRGDASITRQELMVMTSRYLDYIWVDLPDSDSAVDSFADKSKIAKWAASYVDEMRAVGLVEGDAQGNFNPQKTATRAEIATMTVRLGNALDVYDAEPSIGGNALSEYSIYSDSLDSAALEDVIDAVKDVTGVSLTISETKTDKSIVFTVDESLKMLGYGITEDNGTLTVAVHHKYATPYLPSIFADAVSLRDSFNIPEGYKGGGVYTLDEAVNASNVSFVCETDKNPLSYKLGESVTFRISIVSDGKLVSIPQFGYSFKPEHGRENTGFATGIGGQLIKTFNGLDKPGSAYLNVYPANRKNQKMTSVSCVLNASVVYDFYNVKSVEKPADFDSFWDAKMAELMKVEPKVLSSYECEICKLDGFKVYCMEIQSLGTVASIHVSYPANAAPGSLRIFGEFDGYGTVSSDRASYQPDAICVAVNRHEVKNHQSDEYYAAYDAAHPDFAFDNPTREESDFLGMVMRDVQAMRFVAENYSDIWNGKDMIVYGGSMGGFQSVAVAGLYDKVSECWPSVPWMCDVGGSTEGRAHGTFFPEYTEGTKYYDSTYFAQRYDGVVSMNAGLGDSICPTSGTVALYNAFKGAKSAIFTQGGEHGAVSGVITENFGVSYGDAELDEMKKDIADNGLAVTPPDYSADRKLNASEQKMKEAADLYTKNVKWIEATFDHSSSITSEILEGLIKDALVSKCSLDDSYTVIVDADSIGAVRTQFQSFYSGSKHIMVDYMITDADGGYYDAVARFLFAK
ncbi:MAG: S-layer homology domain-containing protein [Clostridia bacterium]|nr:S-layer homology domain-containing protein [Clostridia bacterium]